MELSPKSAFRVLRTYLKNSNPKKYAHSIRVATISQFLARKWGESVDDAIIAAMLHDIGKSMSDAQMASLCMRNNIPVYEFEILENITALHGKVSAMLFEREFRGNDPERMSKIAHAISSHVAGAEPSETETEGNETMSLLDKIIFVADNLESKKEAKELLKVQ